MTIKTIIFLFISTNVSGQQFSEKYNNLAIDAESLLSQKKYVLAATRYSEAFNESKGTGMRMDFYNAAKAWSLSEIKDSAYYYLFNLANSKSYYSLENMVNEKAFTHIRSDNRWENLLKLNDANKHTMTKAIPANYQQHFVEGYEILFDTILVKNFPGLRDSIILQLKSDFKVINLMKLNQKIIDFFKTIRFFIDYTTKNTGAQYHARENEDWLLQNNSLVEKAGCIELSNANNYLLWRKQNQPYMILHELAHAYHDKVLGHKFRPILSAYGHAKITNLYLNVAYHSYDTVYITRTKAYALENEKEYFAELTESFLGLNDFYPFNRKELFKYDRIGYNVVKNIWKN